MTRPTPAMRRAMADAEVGDDGYGEDPTVNRLQDAFAERLGFDQALFVPSGVMANQIALAVLTKPGDAVIAGRRCHIVNHERGATARNCGVQLTTVADPRGVLDRDAVRDIVAAAAHHQLDVGAIAVENSAMASGGTPLPVGEVAELAEFGAPVHLDGARLFNASVATGVGVAMLAGGAATVMCCLSKGLGAPVGSLLALPADLRAAAADERKRFGGAMRQAGVLAAAGLVALDSMVERLAQDHQRASALAASVENRWPNSQRDVGGGGTNMVVFCPPDADAVIVALGDRGVLCGTVAPGVVRLVTHFDLTDEQVAEACSVIESLD